MRCMVDFQTNLHLSGFRSFFFGETPRIPQPPCLWASCFQYPQKNHRGESTQAEHGGFGGQVFLLNLPRRIGQVFGEVVQFKLPLLLGSTTLYL